MHAGGVGPPRGGVIDLAAAGLPAPPNTTAIAIQTTHEAVTRRELEVEWANELSHDASMLPDGLTTS